ncbi:MAG: O-antigen ligase family protein [Plesiomonas sp.]|uniref:O-antigen ligase family protein n=1 Tax=Plesiomonas sp. TaxID=2486279 RepID=UPI003F34324C
MNLKSNISISIIITLTLSLSFAMFNIAISRDLFYVSGYLSIIYIGMHYKSLTLKDNILPISIFVFGLSKIVWVLFFQHDASELNNLYNAYFDVGKRLVISAFIISFAIHESNSNHKQKLMEVVFFIIPLIAIGIACYSIYQVHILGFERTELSTNRATATAYMLTPVLLASIYCIIKKGLNIKKTAILLCIFSLSIYSIFLTQTRAAILTYTLSALLLLTLSLTKKIRIITLLSTIIILSLGICLSYQSIIKPRTDQAIHEIISFDKLKDNGSLGNRFTMWIAGINSFNEKPFGQSAEQRDLSINNQVNNNEVSHAILQYVDVHLHSEIIDTLSLQGIFACITLFLFYGIIVFYSLKEKNSLLFIIALTVIVYGLSDVLFFSQEVTVTYMAAIAIAIIIGKKKNEHSTL